MIELPEELWTLIKEYQIEHKKHHSIKYKNVIRKINYSFGPRITSNCLSFPPPKIWEWSGWLQECWGEGVIRHSPNPNPNGEFVNINGVEFVRLKLELTAIIHHRKKCSNWASQFPPVYVTACYGWQNLKKKHPNKY